MIRRSPVQSQPSPIDQILPLLRKVRQRQIGQWLTCCPAHSDRSPSLSVREASDGAVLIKCFAGCLTSEITAALGLDLSDLFPPREQSKTAPKRTPRLLSPGQALELLEKESMLTLMMASKIIKGGSPSDKDFSDLLIAVGRIQHIRAETKWKNND